MDKKNQAVKHSKVLSSRLYDVLISTAVIRRRYEPILHNLIPPLEFIA